ncbi:hypothetical protein GCM10010910_29210 [Microbacterium nanhaiense]|uniref:Multidrug DMT transporter permease n=1 Tax=Microbacterium nanhaiense TaxID=1301026 RepID=A0ABQ2N3T2_9MICO|nr:DMT family transporter [Microbacterium nanhaiense]GGO67438.1 hypothetical protein GCM10010910_29210 [Microbacterium nanhaiense]
MHVFAVLLAAVSAIGLAAGTHLQHRAVSSATPSTAGGPRAAVLLALRRPSWLLGTGIIVAATALSIVALGLAPVALVQPVGALSLVGAALISARVLRVRLNRSLVIGIGVAVLSVAAFVALSSGFVRDTRPAVADLFALAWLMLALIVVAITIARTSRGHLARVITAGVLFGTVAAAMHIIASETFACLARESCRFVAPLGELLPLGVLGGLVVVGSGCGAWLVQTAYASGPPETVLAALTVIDPIVAVLVGAVILGEYVIMPIPVILAVALTGIIACVGIAMIVRHHPGHLRPSEALDTHAPVVDDAVHDEDPVLECRSL